MNPQASTLAYALYKFGLFCLPAVGFCVPLSVTGTNIFLLAAAASCLLSGKFFEKFKVVKANPLVISIVMIMAIAGLSLFWSIAPWNERFSSLHKYAKLLYIIFLIPLCLDETWKNRAINAFLFAMVLTVIISFLKQYMGLRFGLYPKDPSWIVNSHIETSYFVAFSAYIFIYRVVFHSNQYKWLYVGLFLLFTWQEFFINDGRTGWLIYLMLIILFSGQIALNTVVARSGATRQSREALFWQQSKAKWQLIFSFLKGAMIGGLLVVLLVGLLYIFSDKVRKDIIYATSGFLPAHLQHDKIMQNRQKSVDLRVQFFKFSLVMANDFPVTGVGAGGFKEIFRQKADIPEWGKILGHPHNEYLLMLVQFGVPGLLLLLYFFYVQWKMSFLGMKDWPLAQALVLSFMLGACYNAFLYTTVTGHFFVFFSALLFSINKVKHENTRK